MHKSEKDEGHCEKVSIYICLIYLFKIYLSHIRYIHNVAIHFLLLKFPKCTWEKLYLKEYRIIWDHGLCLYAFLLVKKINTMPLYLKCSLVSFIVAFGSKCLVPPVPFLN